MWCILFLSSLLPFTNSCWTPSFSFNIYRVCLYRFWGERFDLHIVKVYSCVLLVHANLIFALLMCQSYKSYLVHRISILYHGDDNVDCNILCLESVHIIPMSIFQWFMCPKIIPTCTHSSFDASLAYVTNVWF